MTRDEAEGPADPHHHGDCITNYNVSMPEWNAAIAYLKGVALERGLPTMKFALGLRLLRKAGFRHAPDADCDSDVMLWAPLRCAASLRPATVAVGPR